MAFDTSLLDTALKERQAANEGERQMVLSKVLALLTELAPTYDIQQAYVFGSVATPGRFGPASDVDIAVEQINPARFFEAMSQFSYSLKREIDLVELDKCHFADKIRREGIRWTRSD